MTAQSRNTRESLLISSTDKDMQKVLKTAARTVAISVIAAEKAHKARLKQIRSNPTRKVSLAV